MAACVIPPGPCPMTTPTERAQVYFANALLPATLPTPPRTQMMPLLPTPPCLVILPISPPKSKPISRADSDERWDARKNAALIKSVSAPGRADAVDRWDSNKKKSVASSPSSSSNSPVSSCQGSSSSQKWNTNKKKQSTISRADRSSTGSNDVEHELM
ncbi:hypothetical protein PR202_ga24751 [Eleusine coracana subsp. coracana]|uniref:Uncharacterized protein n=1 Tax=Eleusine coracana subsp. coracana TaxID=191504 RepID=A0AAV5D9L6_ELECO|nr:hypothetical protein QOZ80_9AG0674990 [Eleusine coracana subsp. coracana]KAK3119779.1 hypothetical protein QOZ80_9AG0675060 [Eleusine coracana subsp. coracana]GJN06967.1 hypothetical protein PR202_ga24751 [Eleusine coracana subsp. coracana]